MPHYYPPRRSITPSSPYTDYYPGVNPYETPLTDKAEASALVPYSPQAVASESTALPAAGGGAAKSTGGFSIPNLGDIKGIVDRLGGIEGILATMGKVQKVMQTVQQFAPMAKLITGLLPGGKGSKLQGGSDKLDEYKPSRRRRSKGGSRNNSRKGSSRRKTAARGRSKSSKRRR
ncbi:hypothetical protein [Paenibacillus bouchesdurhonensis]|uniref:hypothetical protein n=1 Tax=Paenibacillus bouchesdurhonensis TaxID=1870990 RepID=UPI000DA61CC7|nr:hypothetical protein [Paenibacillus bouchesdurhonensis]